MFRLILIEKANKYFMFMFDAKTPPFAKKLYKNYYLKKIISLSIYKLENYLKK